jgi:parallel beta-helix repeat protein
VSFANGEDANSVLAGFTVRGATRGLYCQATAPTIAHCRIVDNVEAGIKLWDISNPTLANCIIAGNGGDGIEMWSPRVSRVITYNYATVLHCTVVGNRGNGIRGGKPVVVNTIVRANGVGAAAAQISVDVATVTYSNVQGGQPGAGNIDADPLFVVPGRWADPADPTKAAASGDKKAVWVGGNYHLRAGSPCIDAGDPALASKWVLFDMDGQARPIGLRPDIGCDEFGLALKP